MMEAEPIKEVARDLGISITGNDADKNRQALALRVNELLERDFERLLSILYRMDVSEQKLKQWLLESPGVDAGLIIADLMIERHDQKIKSRQQFKQRDNDISEEEKW